MKRKLFNVFIIMLAFFVFASFSYDGINSLQIAYAVGDDDTNQEEDASNEGVMPKLPEIPELTDEYKIVETYETDWTDVISYDIKYDEYDVFPHYVVGLSYSKRKIYEEPDKSTEVLDKISYGNKVQTIALIEDEDENQWYAVICEDDDKTAIGYVQAEKVSKRKFQLEEMQKYLESVSDLHERGHIVYLENYKYRNGYAPRMPNGSYYDDFGYRRGQSIAGYYDATMDGKFRYIPDGMLGVVEQIIEITETKDEVIVIDDKGHFTDKSEFSEYFGEEKDSEDDDEKDAVEEYNETTEVTAVKVYIPSFGVSLWVEEKYLNEDEDAPDVLDQTIIVDRENQTIAIFEYDDEWKVISMSYSSTGKTGEFSLPTPLGYYMAITKKPKFDYVEDGTTTIVGFAPHAIRFSGGGYLHGVPMNYSFDEFGNKKSPTRYTEYLASIGTIPKSHMCVRNYTSHAKFVYDWVDIGNCAVIVME